PSGSESRFAGRTDPRLAGTGNPLPALRLLYCARRHSRFRAATVRSADCLQAYHLRKASAAGVSMASVIISAREVSEFKPSLVLLLWDGFTGSNELVGDVIVRIGSTDPLFVNAPAEFVFGNLPD